MIVLGALIAWGVVVVTYIQQKQRPSVVRWSTVDQLLVRALTMEVPAVTLHKVCGPPKTK